MNQIFGFMHVYQVHDWANIVYEQMRRISDSGLSGVLGKLFIGVNGNQDMSQMLRECPKAELLYQIDKPDLYEALTLNCLYNFSTVLDGKVFYIHTKGVSRGSPQGQADWRRMMEYYTIDHHTLCMQALEKYDVAGANWHLGEGYMNAHPRHSEGIPICAHFSGGMWWANTSYVRRLKPLHPLQSRFQCEFWIGTGEPKVAELYNSYVHHNSTPYPPHVYEGTVNLRFFIGKQEIKKNG